MLDKALEKKILDFVYQQPRSIQEIAHAIDKNWRTADSYVEKIAKETGSIGIRIFRPGTRGSLKVVFSSKMERIHSSEFQERLFKRIETRRGEDFSPFELYAYVPKDKRKAWRGKYSNTQVQNQQLARLLASAKEQVLIFTGTCAFINIVEGKMPLLEMMHDLARRGVSIKVLSRIDLASVKNLQQLLSVNYVGGKDAIEVHHSEQPLRGFIIDDAVVRLTEELNTGHYRAGELDASGVILYEIYDLEWVKWMQSVFWSIFRTSLPGQNCLEELQGIYKS